MDRRTSFTSIPGTRWESGRPVTSDDVRYTIERVRDPKVARAQLAGAVRRRRGDRDPGSRDREGSLRATLCRSHVSFTLPIVSRGGVRKGGERGRNGRHPVGSGPYRLESWESNQKLRLVRRDGAANADGHSDEIVFRVIPTDSIRYQAGLRGELDEFRLSRDQTKIAEGVSGVSGPLSLRSRAAVLEVLLICNCRHPFLSDRRVRRALAQRWPREETANACIRRKAPGSSRDRILRASRRTLPASLRPHRIRPRRRSCSTRPAGRRARRASGAGTPTGRRSR